MLQIIPVNKRTENQVDSDTIKYIENVPHDSMAKKYNRAIEQFVLNSKEKYVCFRHDDTELRSPLDVIEFKVDKVCQEYNAAVMGVIGTIALDQGCAWWHGVPSAGGRANYGAGSIIQGGIRPKLDENKKPVLDDKGNPVMEHYEYPMNDYPGNHKFMATVDGCCMFFPKWFFEKGFRFDELLPDFHFYDADICLQALAAGYRVATVAVSVKHESQGELPKNWEQLRLNFYNKWTSAVNGNWPISRLSKFDMSRIKTMPTKKVDNGNQTEKT